jgi:hypothetical protein
MRMKLARWGALAVAAAGCSSGGAPVGVVPVDAGPDGSPGGDGGVLACSDLFQQDVLRTYAVDIAPADWAAIETEFADVSDLLAGVDVATYHPAVFHMDGETVAGAAIKLHGQSSWVDAETMDGPRAKMQFTVSFEQADPNAKFHGVGKITFDMPRTDFTFLHERLSNAWLRQIGIMAPCAASARLNINGAYYGLYVAEESVGPRLIQEFFPADPAGDLWKGGTQLQNNAATASWSRNSQFWAATDVASVAAIVDLPSSLLTWAAEAALNDSDGYYGGNHNFYLYDQGAPGYVFVPTDLDATFDWLAGNDLTPFDDHPVFWWSQRRQPAPLPGPQWVVVMGDAGWRQKYAEAIATQLGKWDVAEVQGWIDAWSAQVADAVAADPHALATPADFQAAVATARDVTAKRPAYLQTFVDCERGVSAADADGDGYAWCDDCNDADPNIHLGAPERCGNQVDDNCDGNVDENCGN